MKNNNQEMKQETNVQELSAEELEQASAGFLGFLIPVAKKIGLEIVNLFK